MKGECDTTESSAYSAAPMWPRKSMNAAINKK